MIEIRSFDSPAVKETLPLLVSLSSDILLAVYGERDLVLVEVNGVDGVDDMVLISQ